MDFVIYIIVFCAGAGIAILFFGRRSKGRKEEDIPYRPEPYSQEKDDSKLQDEVPPMDETMRKQINNLFLVNELSQRITSSLSVEESFSHLYQTINSMMDASVVELVVIDHDERTFYSNKKYEIKEDQLKSYNHFSEWTFSNNKEVLLDDAENDFGRYVFKPLILPDGKNVKSLMCFPVSHHDIITGTLCIISFNKNAFESFHREMIRLLLPFVGVAINNAANHQEIIELKQRAERSEQFMQVFLANMSHEIRTPMNAVMGMTNLLLQKNPMPEQLKYLNTIQKSSDNLLVILNDILDLSKIEAGKMEFEKIDFSLNEVTGNVREIMQLKAEEKGLILNVKTDKDIPDVLMGDPTRLTQILINLVGNAVKFTEKGSVDVNVQLLSVKENKLLNDMASIRFSVSDTGIGMSNEQQKKLFQNFTQASTETSRKYGGTGLGLSISRQLVKLQGGEIEIQSEPGRGSKFSFTIDYAVSRNKAIEKKESISEEMLSELEGIRVLLADDNYYNRIVVKETLELKIKGIVVDEAKDGLVALQMLEKNDYDLLLMDLVMPNLNGLETTQKIRNEFVGEKKNIPIVAITASVIKKEIEKCYTAGMNGFIPKPFKAFEIFTAIHNALHGSSQIINESSITSTAKSNGKLIDLSYLEEYSEGDPVRMKRYVDLFIVRAPGDIEEMKLASGNGDYDKIRITSHSMKSQLKFNGIVEGFEIAEKIEQDCLENNYGEIPQLIQKLDDICNRAVKELKGMKI